MNRVFSAPYLWEKLALSKDVVLLTIKKMKRIIVPGFASLLLALLDMSGRREKLQREVATLQARNRFLYTGNTCLPQIALTFDDGPDPVYTAQIRDVLEGYGVKATFFCIGQQVMAFPELVKQLYDDGHVIGNHSWSHPVLALSLRDTIRAQLARTSSAIEQATGALPAFFRPPYGFFSSPVLSVAGHLSMATVLWNVRATDWAKPGVGTIVDRVCGRAEDGAIILLHDGGGDRSETVQALPAIIDELRQRGFQFVTLQQLEEGLGSTPRNIGGPGDEAWSDILLQYLKKRPMRELSKSSVQIH